MGHNSIFLNSIIPELELPSYDDLVCQEEECLLQPSGSNDSLISSISSTEWAESDCEDIEAHCSNSLDDPFAALDEEYNKSQAMSAIPYTGLVHCCLSSCTNDDLSYSYVMPFSPFSCEQPSLSECDSGKKRVDLISLVDF